jgi:nicotinate dehydrogenase subunit B
MSENQAIEHIDNDVEPERYELFAKPSYLFNLEIDRRDFFKLLGGGLVLVFAIDAFAQEGRQGDESGGRRGQANATPKEIGGWLHIDEDGSVNVFTGKVEFGQNIRTSLAQVVAEELNGSISSIKLTMGDTDLTPFDMGTFGSRTTPTMAPQLRKVAAAAREVLIDMAATEWKVDRAELSVKEGKVINNQSKQTLEFGKLTRGQKLVKLISDTATSTPADQWKVAGKSFIKVDGKDFVTGKHRYTSDVTRPGMLFGKIVRPSAFNASVASVDTHEAAALPGVKVVNDGSFIGVVAPSAQAASRAANAIKVEWKSDPQPSASTLFSYLKKEASPSPGNVRGSVADGLASATKKLEQTYTVAYIAHAPLEPRAAVAEWNNGKLTVWTGTQRPFGVKSELAEAFRIPEDKVRVIVPDTGAGYGGKHTGEMAIEAARLAQAAGKPVKLVWSREEEFTWAYFRPAGVIDISSGVRDDGVITAWELHNYNSGSAGIQHRYDIPNHKIVFHQTKSPLRQGSYRGLAATANHFAREVHIDEIARELKMDPLELRLKNLKDDRMKNVLLAASKSFGWDKRKSASNVGYGIAGGFEKGGYVATCAEVSIDRASGGVKITRVVEAFECGAVVNPDQLKNQIEGSVVMAIGGALFEAIDFENGKINNPRFSRYRVPRFSDLPVVEAVLVDRKDLPSAGAGETPIVGLAPAVGNAIFDATGVRLRSLPMVPNGLKG